jgi:hypothetical protein
MNANITLQNPSFSYGCKGFCSIVCGIIDIALEHYYEFDNVNCFVDDNQVLKLFNNNFEFFEDNYDSGSRFLSKYFSSSLRCSQHTAHTLANIEDLKLKNFIFNSILSVKDELKEKFNKKFDDLGITENTLGVQIRGTDKKNEVDEPSIDNIIKKIDFYFETLHIKNIFLTTDDIRYLNGLLDKYKDLIIFDDTNMISETHLPLHVLPDRDRINEEVLSSVYLLSKCSHFLYSFSNVSHLALIMGVHNFQSITNLNQE